jgi:hypothetical protein
MGQEDYARKRKRGGRVKLGGVRPRHRLDRPSRRKFDSGGTADAGEPGQTTAPPDDAPPSSGRGFVDSLMANPKVRAIAAGLAGIGKGNPVVLRAAQEPMGPKPAYHRGGRARR